MFNSYKKSYQPLRGTDGTEEETHFRASHYAIRLPIRAVVLGLLILLASSISVNALLIYQKQRWASEKTPVSKYASLERNLMLPFTISGHENDDYDELWETPSSDTGMVVLKDSYVAEMQLPIAQRSPWDVNKGMYYLHGHHNLHCLGMIRKSIKEYRHHWLQTQHHLHIDHCLIALREDIICDADDTPRYMDQHHEQPGSGQDQYRLCRDWGKLDAWANEHSACFQMPKHPYDGADPRDPFKFCPDGSEPWKSNSA